jgi:hypothetical protein
MGEVRSVVVVVLAAEGILPTSAPDERSSMAICPFRSPASTSFPWNSGADVPSWYGEVAAGVPSASTLEDGPNVQSDGEEPSARRWTGAASRKVWTHLAVPTSQSRTVASRDEERTCRPTSIMAEDVRALVWPVRVRGLEPVSAENTRSVRSVDVDRTTLPDGNCV